MKSGFSLIELVVVILILGLMAGISGGALTSLRLPQSAVEQQHLSRARIRALTDGRPVALGQDSLAPTLFLPDGRGIGAGIDPLTGSQARRNP